MDDFLFFIFNGMIMSFTNVAASGYAYIPKSRSAFSVVTHATSSRETPFREDSLSAIIGIYALSFRVPRYGAGVRYGESVSSTMRSSGIVFTVSAIEAFLNVITPPIPTIQSP